MLSTVAYADESLEGALSTPKSPLDQFPTPIKDKDLAKWISDNIPQESKKLLIFAMCFGGNFLDDFVTNVNASVTSCNEPGTEGQRPGYSEAVPGALKPGEGRTAEDAHKEAKVSAGSERPQSGGGLPLNQFPLDPTKPNDASANVRSRHILIYAGDPLEPNKIAKKGDDELRDEIKQNFPGDSIKTIGGLGSSLNDDGSGMDGWDRQANAAELKKAIEQIGQDIKNSAHPEKEQFIFVVLDHGTGTKTKELPKPTLEDVDVPGVGTFNDNDFDPRVIRQDPDNTVGFSILVELTNTTHAVSPNHYTPYFQPGDWTVDLQDDQGSLITHLNSFHESAYELGNYLVGDESGEGLRVFFPIDEEFLLTNLFNRTVTVRVQNHTAGTARDFLYPIAKLVWETGAISPVSVPEPCMSAMLPWIAIVCCFRSRHARLRHG